MLAPSLAAAAPAAKRSAGAALRVSVDKSKVDLKEHRLELRMSAPAGKVKIVVTSENDAVLADEEHDFTGRPPGSPLVVTWQPSSDAAVARIDLRAYDANGAWTGNRDRALVRAHPARGRELPDWLLGDFGERGARSSKRAYAKLDEVLAKDKAHGRMHPGITLFIAGHTDTVGSASANLKLSQERARSIAGWFRKRGVRLPISYEGFGETSLAVKTADNVDEARNRRADYVLSDGPPGYAASFRPSWKRIP